MKAYILTEYGSPLYLNDIPKPVPRANEVLVKILASGLNPLDIKIMSGRAPHAKVTPPAVLGIDMAGVIEQVGEEVKSFKEGDKVYGMIGGVGQLQGSLAEYAAVDAALLAHKPANLDMRHSAALPLVLITAWEGLIDRAKVKQGHKVLIHGGAGGVGHVAVQLAMASGAEVYATDTGRGIEYLKQSGATPINVNQMSQDEYTAVFTGGKGFDIVFDTIGGATLDSSFKAVKKYTGHVVSALGWGTHSIAPLSFKGASYSGIFTLMPLLTGEAREAHGQILHQAKQLAEEGKLFPRLFKYQFPFEETNKAYEMIAALTTYGKVVVDLSLN